MWYCSSEDQIIYILILNVVILMISVIRVGIFWVNRNTELKFLIISAVMDPIIVIVLFGILVMVYINCLRGIRNSNIKMFIPFFMSLPVTTSALIGFAGYGFYYDDWCLSWLLSWECISYPGFSIAWSILNLYLLMLTIKQVNKINQQNIFPRQDVEDLTDEICSNSKQMKITKSKAIMLINDNENSFLNENFKSRHLI